MVTRDSSMFAPGDLGNKPLILDNEKTQAHQTPLTLSSVEILSIRQTKFMVLAGLAHSANVVLQ